MNEEEKRKLQEYQQFCVEYNLVATEYNAVISEYNTMLSEFSSFEFLEFPQPFKKYDCLTSDEKPQGWNQELYEEQKNEMKQVSANAESYCNQLIIGTYNCVIDEYNQVAEAYNDAVKETSVEFISELPKEASIKERITAIDDRLNQGAQTTKSVIEEEIRKNEELAAYLGIVRQISDPSEDWVKERLDKVEGVLGYQAVSLGKDPNQLLGKDGGYTACVYFSHKGVDQSLVKGNDIVEKGTDCGGAIEVYANKNDALNRCEYLSQFDGTLLYTGSYIIIGTMVIRTSYKLSNQQQVDLTNAIIESFTCADISE